MSVPFSVLDLSPIPSGADAVQALRNTLDQVRALPLWRRIVPPAIFFGIVALLIVGLVGAVASIRHKRPDVPEVDLRAESRSAAERQLRTQANELLRQGKVQSMPFGRRRLERNV